MPDYIRQAAVDPSQGRFNDGDLAQAYRRNPLATDVRYWCHWMLEKAREELAEFYPPDLDGSVPVAYLWSRTVPCPNCDAEMPLIRQYWLSRRDRKRVALEPVIDHDAKLVDFKVVEGLDVTGDPAEATTSRGDTRCLLCGQVVKGVEIRQLGINGQMSATLTSVILVRPTEPGMYYREDSYIDWKAYKAAEERLQILHAKHQDDLTLVPDEPIDSRTLGLRVDAFGIDHWSKLFNDRQLLAMTTFAQLAKEAYLQMLECGLDEEYAKAIATYLGLAIDRQATRTSTSSFWDAGGQKVQQLFARQALPMVWDYVECTPLQEGSGGFSTNINFLVDAVIQQSIPSIPGTVLSRDARIRSDAKHDYIVTDPPYYNSIDYAGLSDFFYVWLKRSIGFLNPDVLSLPLSPKTQQAIMASERNDASERERYVEMVAHSFQAMADCLDVDGLTGIVFAHTDPDAWATLIEGLLSAGIVPGATWPIDTEAPSGLKAVGQARLKTSVWMSCRKREEEAGEAFLGDVLEEMRPVVRERLLYFWSKGIRGADFFISAIGPALSVFGRYERVLRPDGSQVSVRDFLDIVRRESTDVALQQVLHGADLGVIDPVTRQYTTWVWSYSRAPLDAGEAIALCLATGASYADTIRAGSIAAEGREKSKKMVRLRTVRQRAMEDEDLGFGTAARPAPLIDQLQYAAWLWGQNRTDDLGGYRSSLGETLWAALRTLGQAVAGCLPDDDEDRRVIMGLLGSNVMAMEPPDNGRPGRRQTAERGCPASRRTTTMVQPKPFGWHYNHASTAIR